MVTFERWPLRCEGQNCVKPPTIHMRVHTKEFGSMGWRYCEDCFRKHVAVIDALNEKLEAKKS